MVFWFLCIVLATLSTSAEPQPEPTVVNDTVALLGFKNSVSQDPSNLLARWIPNSDYCSWYGVTCNELSKRVVALNLTSTSTLAGTLPDSVGDLTELRALVITHNAFSGDIPLSIRKLQNLEVLELQGNNFSGRIPENLESLVLLNLSSNSFSGEIPDGLIGYGRLEVIDLSNNQLTGGIKVNNLSHCSFLKHLKLSNNFLKGNIPKEIGKCKNLRTLLLDGNILQGKIPSEIGQISELRVFDVSTNCFSEKIPKELAICRKLSVLVLTNSSNFVGGDINGGLDDDSKLEFNAFDGGIPSEIFTLPSLQILWAPRANLGGRLPGNWSDQCSLRVIHLGFNSFKGVVPKSLEMCKNLAFLDLSSNYLEGYLPMHLQVPCMLYFNVSQNNLSGVLPSSPKGWCDSAFSMISFGQDHSLLEIEDVKVAYSSIPVWSTQMISSFGSTKEDDFIIVHDFSRNQFSGPLPVFSVGDELLATKKNKPAYRLLLNENMLNGSFPDKLILTCNNLMSFSVNLSANFISGEIHEGLFLSCPRIMQFEAAYNRIRGSLPSDIGNLTILQYFDIRGNLLSGSLPNQIGNLTYLKSFLLGRNSLSGNIPSPLGQLSFLTVLDLSHNAVAGSIPASLANARNLQVVQLNSNELSGEIPTSFLTLSNLIVLDVSFNKLSGHIPHFQNRIINCDWFKGNYFLEPCPLFTNSAIDSNEDEKRHRKRNLKSLIITVVIPASSAVVSVFMVATLIIILRKRQFSRRISRGKVVVTFADSPAELSYETVVRATGNFSIRNLIGSGGFGSTYKAELAPGYFVAVKRLYLGKFQGIQQFDAEIRTLGRIRHKNLVTLIGYYMGESEMFLIYNYLSGGNLETFIHERLIKNLQWSVIFKIAFDVAQALAYLHYSCVPRVLHRDIKPSNILLDDELNAYLSDFGLARLIEVSQTHATTDVAGTFGYVAPEYATTCRVSDKSDVYSFGIVMLELMSGKKSLDPSFSEYGNGFNIVSWAKLLIKEGRFAEVFSVELWEAGPKEKLLGMLRLAANCTVDSLSVRPSMKHVLEKLKQLKSFSTSSS
ncbi:LRR receptor-like serine/threonine-protein kinase RPK2 [Mercurialis annua]|uniref:LRR receptor-like serine/threonine-protein kinase RPK2 n=1 Tax=Mercurialis annua TaxID=3986 RepID=UPI00215F395A|nr:LRR receptor-like serine/threonine-protein kinase RPK2 [Mercurialis annua]